MTVFTLLLSLSLFLWTHAAQAAVLCSKKGGAVFLRESCKTHETPVDPAALGIQPPAVYDANGKKVGDAADTYGNLFFRFGERVVSLQVSSDGIFNGGENVHIAYPTATDCSGPPFMDAPDPSELKRVFPRGYVAGPEHTLYIPDPDSTPQVIISKSRFNQYGGPCITGDVYLYTAIPAIPLVDLDTLFTPPFSVR